MNNKSQILHSVFSQDPWKCWMWLAIKSYDIIKKQYNYSALVVGHLGAISISTCHLSSIDIPIIKIRCSQDCLIFIMEILIIGKMAFILTQPPEPHECWEDCQNVISHFNGPSSISSIKIRLSWDGLTFIMIVIMRKTAFWIMISWWLRL